MKVVTRIPPSPTGKLHIGTARTALFNYLFARRAGGTVIFRSEDTDRARSRLEYENEILEGLAWLGLSWDAFSRQSARGARYAELLSMLVREGKAYLSREAAKDGSGREVEVVRLKNPGVSLTFTDLVRGEISFDTAELGDFVIARSPTDALYHFAVVADDMDGGVTHVIRGEDHISNTPRQILIQEALRAPRPAYAHLPLILDERRAKLSKRSGATSVMEYRAEGFLPEALVNYLALLGWSPGGAREDFSLAELVAAFSLDGIQKGGASFDREKLRSVNQRWMRKCTDEEYLAHLQENQNDVGHTMSYMLAKSVPLLKERAKTFGEARGLLSGELRGLFSAPALTREKLLAQELPGRLGIAARGLAKALEIVEALSQDIPAEAAKEALMPIAETEEAKGKGGRGAVLWPLRYALSGEDRSPDPFSLVAILGRDEVARRIRAALGILDE